jgi:hypothetical protein
VGFYPRILEIDESDEHPEVDDSGEIKAQK